MNEINHNHIIFNMACMGLWDNVIFALNETDIKIAIWRLCWVAQENLLKNINRSRDTELFSISLLRYLDNIFPSEKFTVLSNDEFEAMKKLVKDNTFGMAMDENKMSRIENIPQIPDVLFPIFIMRTLLKDWRISMFNSPYANHFIHSYVRLIQ